MHTENTQEDQTPEQTTESTQQGNEQGMMPQPTFTTLVLSLASSALVQLGEVPDPASGKTETNTILAKHSIDLLTMLQEKTTKGLDAEETRLLEGILYELRMKYVVKQ